MKKILAMIYLSVALYAGYNMAFAEEPVYKNATVVVASGETLWEIAERYRDPEEDVRIVVERIRDANKLKQCWIYPGQDLLVPVRVDSDGPQVAVK